MSLHIASQMQSAASVSPAKPTHPPGAAAIGHHLVARTRPQACGERRPVLPRGIPLSRRRRPLAVLFCDGGFPSSPASTGASSPLTSSAGMCHRHVHIALRYPAYAHPFRDAPRLDSQVRQQATAASAVLCSAVQCCVVLRSAALCPIYDC